jgi:GTPase SAR1 family protein
MWVKELRQQLGPDLPILIVGNKSDLENNRQIKKEEAEKYAASLGLDHFSASARTGQNVKEIFKVLTERK